MKRGKSSAYGTRGLHFTISVLMLASALFALIALGACTFDYGELEPSERTMPDLIMENVDYVRIRSSDPVARLLAERVERYERIGLMKLQVFSFEQFANSGEEVNAAGSAGKASYIIESGDIVMEDSVRLEVESEDIVIETNYLEWKDAQRILSSGDEEEVHIHQQTGTNFTGIGLIADVRRRAWEFTNVVSGIYVLEDTDEEQSSNE